MVRILDTQRRGIKATQRLQYPFKISSIQCGPISTNTLVLAVEFSLWVCPIRFDHVSAMPGVLIALCTNFTNRRMDTLWSKEASRV